MTTFDARGVELDDNGILVGHAYTQAEGVAIVARPHCGGIIQRSGGLNEEFFQ